MTDLVLTPGRLLPGLPGDRARAGRCAAGGVTVDAGGVLRLPPRALRRPRAAADVPPARDRPHRRARGRRRVARRAGATARVDAAARRSASTPTSTSPADPFFGRSGRMLAASQREQALKFEVLVPIAGPEPTAVASFNYHQDHFAGALRHRAGRRRRRAHRLPGLRPRARSRWRCCAPTGSTPTTWPDDGALRSCGRDEPPTHRHGEPARRSTRRPTRRTRCTRRDRTYRETNCYTDILIELLHARGDEPLAAMGCTRADGLRGRPVDVLQAAARGPRAAVRHRHPRDAAVPAAARRRSPSSSRPGGR